MRLDIVRQPLLATFITLLVFAVGATTRTGELHLASELIAKTPSLLGVYIAHWQDVYSFAARTLCVFLIFYSGVTLGRMTVRYSLYSLHTYLAIPLYGFFACGLFVSSGFAVEYLSGALLVLSLNSFYASFRSGDYGFGAIFRGSLCIGIIPLIYTPALVLFLVIPLAVFLFKRSAREFLVASIGYLFPLFVICYLNWAMDGAFVTPVLVLFKAFIGVGDFWILNLDSMSLAMLCVTLLLFLCAGVCYFLDIYAAGPKSRSILLFNLSLFIVIGSMLFMPCASAASVAMLAIPIAVVLPLLFVRLNHSVALFLYLGMIALCIIRLFF